MRIAQAAFTLVELMVVLAIIAVLAVLASGWNDAVANNRRAGAINEFVAAINQARSEAISRGVTVTICKSANPNAATPACGAAGGWESGWIIFADPTNVGTIDAAEQPPLKAHSAISVLTMTGRPNVGDRMSFNPGGTMILAAAANFVRFCDSRGFTNASGVVARDVEISIGGRFTTTTPAPGGTCP